MIDIIKKIKALKAEENLLQKMRKSLEKELVSKIETKLEGTTKTEVEDYVVTVTTKLNRKLDYDQYLALDLPENLSFIDLKPSINLKNLRHIEHIDPDIVHRCVTTTPATPTIKIEEKK